MSRRTNRITTALDAWSRARANLDNAPNAETLCAYTAALLALQDAVNTEAGHDIAAARERMAAADGGDLTALLRASIAKVERERGGTLRPVGGGE